MLTAGPVLPAFSGGATCPENTGTGNMLARFTGTAWTKKCPIASYLLGFMGACMGAAIGGLAWFPRGFRQEQVGWEQLFGRLEVTRWLICRGNSMTRILPWFLSWTMETAHPHTPTRPTSRE